jgi:hypothetical protein
MQRRESDARQLEIPFEVPAPPPTSPGALDADAKVRLAVSQAIKRSPRSRAEIAARMTELSGHRVTEHVLNAWSAPTRRAWRFPLSLAVAFEVAAESYALTELHNGLRGCKTLIGEQALAAEWGRLEQLEMELKARKRALRARMEGR